MLFDLQVLRRHYEGPIPDGNAEAVVIAEYPEVEIEHDNGATATKNGIEVAAIRIFDDDAVKIEESRITIHGIVPPDEYGNEYGDWHLYPAGYLASVAVKP